VRVRVDAWDTSSRSRYLGRSFRALVAADAAGDVRREHAELRARPTPDLEDRRPGRDLLLRKHATSRDSTSRASVRDTDRRGECGAQRAQHAIGEGGLDVRVDALPDRAEEPQLRLVVVPTGRRAGGGGHVPLDLVVALPREKAELVSEKLRNVQRR